MRVLTGKDGDFIPYFDENNETGAGIKTSSLKHVVKKKQRHRR